MSEGWLVGWKEIARYIGYSVGTAKKYHYDYRMPVLRNFGKVKADPDELDKWIRGASQNVTKNLPKKDHNLTRIVRSR